MGFAGARPLASFKGGESWLDVCAHLCRPSRARGFYTSVTQRLRAGLNCVAPTALELRPACAMASARQASSLRLRPGRAAPTWEERQSQI